MHNTILKASDYWIMVIREVSDKMERNHLQKDSLETNLSEVLMVSQMVVIPVVTVWYSNQWQFLSLVCRPECYSSRIISLYSIFLYYAHGFYASIVFIYFFIFCWNSTTCSGAKVLNIRFHHFIMMILSVLGKHKCNLFTFLYTWIHCIAFLHHR